MTPPTILFAPGSVSAASVVRHARYSADGIGRSALLSLPAPLFVLPTEAALGDLQSVSIAVVVPPLIPSVESVAAVEAIAALSTRAVSVEGQRES